MGRALRLWPFIIVGCETLELTSCPAPPRG